MGTLVRFPMPQEVAAAKTEAILNRIGELYQQKQKAKEELPGVLARLVEAGQTELALQALVLWGSGEMEAYEVLAMIAEKAECPGRC